MKFQRFVDHNLHLTVDGSSYFQIRVGNMYIFYSFYYSTRLANFSMLMSKSGDICFLGPPKQFSFQNLVIKLPKVL